MADVFGNSQFNLNEIGTESAKEISKNRAIIEQKEKGEDMSKTVGETKLFMSAHGIANALKPVKPRIKKLVNRKIGDFKKAASNKISDFIDGDGGKSRRLKEFQQEQEELNASDEFSDVRSRFGKFSDEDKDAVRSNLKENPEFTGKADMDELDEAEGAAAKLKNTQLLKDEVSKTETKNFVENDAKQAAEAETSTAESAEPDVASLASKATNFVKSGAQSVKDGVADLAKKTIKSEAKAMAKSTVETEAAEETAGEVGSAALDAIPGADVVGAVVGAVIAIKKAVQVGKLERKDKALVAAAPVTGAMQQVGV
tara:strand:- start:2526 stop:3464 length:939 start_codon:yes stop_codon:yes gene_type:complete